jgi:hypothetical protein
MNPHFGDALWEILEKWMVFIGVTPSNKLFERCRIDYDGHVMNYVTIFGLCFGHCYDYASQAVRDKREKST